jgi:hypothetical protein
MPTTESQQTWEKVAAEKRAALLSSFPSKWVLPDKLLPPEGQDDVSEWIEASGWFTPQELAITSLTASALLQKLAASELSSIDVTTAFCKRAVVAQQLVRPFTFHSMTFLLTEGRPAASLKPASTALSSLRVLGMST